MSTCIILELDGWRKRLEVEPLIIRRGYIEVCLPPLFSSYIANKDVEVCNTTDVRIVFQSTNRTIYGIPVYELA